MKTRPWVKRLAVGLLVGMLAGDAGVIPASAQMSRGRGGTRPMRSGQRQTADEPAGNFNGEVRSVNGRKLVLLVEDGNTLELRFDKHTKFFDGDRTIKPAELSAGDRVQTEVKHAIDGSLDLLSLRRQPDSKEPQGGLR